MVWWAPIAAAGIQAGGGLISAFGTQAESQGSLMNRQQEIQIDTAKALAQNYPKWEMAGLRKAGLHPYLRYGKGGTSPQIPAPSSSIPGPSNRYGALGEHIAGVGTSAVEAYGKLVTAEKDLKTLEKIGAEIHKIEADTDLSKEQKFTEIARQRAIWAEEFQRRTQAELNVEQRKLLYTQQAQAQWEVLVSKHRARLAELQIPRAEVEARIWQTATAEFIRWLMLFKDGGVNIPGAAGVGKKLFF